MLCASPEYLLKHGLPRTPEELERHICLQHNGCSNASLSWQFSSADSTRRIRISPVSRLSVNSAELLVEGALQGLGIIHAPTWLVHEEVVSGRLVTFSNDTLCRSKRRGIYGDRRFGGTGEDLAVSQRAKERNRRDALLGPAVPADASSIGRLLLTSAARTTTLSRSTTTNRVSS